MSEPPPVRDREQAVERVLAVHAPSVDHRWAERIVDALLPQPDPEFVAGMRELGYIVGRNPDGVDDSVAATLLVLRGLKAAGPPERPFLGYDGKVAARALTGPDF